MAIPEDVKAYIRKHAHHGPGAAAKNREVFREAWARHRGRYTVSNPRDTNLLTLGLIAGAVYLVVKAREAAQPKTPPKPPPFQYPVTGL